MRHIQCVATLLQSAPRTRTSPLKETPVAEKGNPTITLDEGSTFGPSDPPYAGPGNDFKHKCKEILRLPFPN